MWYFLQSKQKVDVLHLQLQNLLYEVMHLQKEIGKCLEFKLVKRFSFLSSGLLCLKLEVMFASEMFFKSIKINHAFVCVGPSMKRLSWSVWMSSLRRPQPKSPALISPKTTLTSSRLLGWTGNWSRGRGNKWKEITLVYTSPPTTGSLKPCVG